MSQKFNTQKYIGEPTINLKNLITITDKMFFYLKYYSYKNFFKGGEPSLYFDLSKYKDAQNILEYLSLFQDLIEITNKKIQLSVKEITLEYIGYQLPDLIYIPISFEIKIFEKQLIKDLKEYRDFLEYILAYQQL